MERQKRDGMVACSSVAWTIGWGESRVSTVAQCWHLRRENEGGKGGEREREREQHSSMLPVLSSPCICVRQCERRRGERASETRAGAGAGALWQRDRCCHTREGWAARRTPAATGTERSRRLPPGHPRAPSCSLTAGQLVQLSLWGWMLFSEVWRVSGVSEVSVLVHSLVPSCLRRCSLCITSKTVCAAGWLREEPRYQSSRYHAEQRGAQQWLLNDLLPLACASRCARVCVAGVGSEHACAATDETFQLTWAVKAWLPKLTLRRCPQLLASVWGLFFCFTRHLQTGFIDLVWRFKEEKCPFVSRQISLTHI